MIDWILKKLNLRKASAIERLIEVTRFDSFGETDDSTGKYTVEYFWHTNPWTSASVGVIAKSISQVPVDFIDSNDEIIEKPELTGFMEQPNPENSIGDFIQSLVFSLELWGNIFIEWVNDEHGKQLYNLRPGNMSVEAINIRDRRYKYMVNGNVHVFKNEEIIHGRFEDPSNDLIGISPITPVINLLRTWERIETYNENFIQQGGRPSGILSSNDQINAVEYERLLEHVKKTFSSENNAGKTAVLPHGMSYQQISQTPKDMDFLEFIKYARESLLAVLQLPPVEVGVFEWANYANSVVQKRIFWEDSLLPLITKLEGILTRAVLPLVGPGLRVKFDLSDVAALRANELEKAQIADIYIGNGTITPNESREGIGKDTDDEAGDVRLVKMGLTPLEDLTFEEDLNEVPVDENDLTGDEMDQRIDQARRDLRIAE